MLKPRIIIENMELSKTRKKRSTTTLASDLRGRGHVAALPLSVPHQYLLGPVPVPDPSPVFHVAHCPTQGLVCLLAPSLPAVRFSALCQSKVAQPEFTHALNVLERHLKHLLNNHLYTFRIIFPVVFQAQGVGCFLMEGRERFRDWVNRCFVYQD